MVFNRRYHGWEAIDPEVPSTNVRKLKPFGDGSVFTADHVVRADGATAGTPLLDPRLN